MKFSMLGLRAALTLLFLAAMFSASFRGMSKAKRFTVVRGTIEQLDPANRVLVLRCSDPARTQTIGWQPETLFANLDGPMLPQDFQPGQRVAIHCETGRGQDIALRVEVEPVYEGQALPQA